MSVDCVIVDPLTGNAASVTASGQLVVAPVNYSEPVQETLAVINTAYPLIAPKSDYRIVITGIILTANKNVGASDATVDIYEASTEITTTVTTSILSLEMIKQSNLVLTGLNLLVPEGLWVSAKTDDNDVFVTIMYYRVKIK